MRHKLDIFIIKSFGLLFAGTFCICLFIFLMQFLWRKVDEIVGKGLSLDVLGQFFYESALALVPQALPLAILLAALITFGNFGERLELLAMKAAGIPLLRVMAPLIVVVTLLSATSFYFQNVIGPDAQVRLYTLLFSVKQKSPELEIPEGVFYDNIEGYNLYVNKKNPKTGLLYGVMIYDMSEGFDNTRIVVADSGRMQSSTDNRHLVLDLFSGEQFENLTSQEVNKKNVPYRREMFDTKRIIIEFDANFSMMDGSFLNKQAASKNMRQLSASADSLTQRMDSIGRTYYTNARQSNYPPIRLQPNDSVQIAKGEVGATNIDSLFSSSTRENRQKWIKAALSKIDQQKSDYKVKEQIVYDNDKNIRRHQIEWWKKITLSLSCLVFFFIGAPLGAITRKGGLGFPVIISVFTFIVYYIFETSGFKMAREGEWAVWFGCWISTFVLAPVGIFFTYKANKDSTVFNVEAYLRLLHTLLAIPAKRSIAPKEVIIEEPRYPLICDELERLKRDSRRYIESHPLRRAPRYPALFFAASRQADTAIDDINRRLEAVVKELGNSRSRIVISELNKLPLLNPGNYRSPLAGHPRCNMAAGIVLPVGLVLYLRVWLFRARLYKDLKKLAKGCSALQRAIEKEKNNKK